MTLEEKTTDKNSVKIQNWRDVVDVDWPEQKITEKTKETIRKYAQRFPIRGDVRLATGRFYTDKEYEERRKRISNDSNHQQGRFAFYEIMNGILHPIKTIKAYFSN